MDFFTTIVELAHERPITAADFTPFIGCDNWLSFDRSEPLGKCDDEPWVTGVIYKFRLIEALKLSNKVHIKVQHADDMWESMTMDADELAIRMDES